MQDVLPLLSLVIRVYYLHTIPVSTKFIYRYQIPFWYLENVFKLALSFISSERMARAVVLTSRRCK